MPKKANLETQVAVPDQSTLTAPQGKLKKAGDDQGKKTSAPVVQYDIDFGKLEQSKKAPKNTQMSMVNQNNPDETGRYKVK